MAANDKSIDRDSSRNLESNDNFVETNKADTDMLLFKTPQPVTRALSTLPDDPSRPVAKVTISVDPLKVNADNSLATEVTMELTGPDSENALRTYSLNNSTGFYPMTVFSESTQGKVAVEGKIVENFNMVPKNVASYEQLSLERKHKRETEKRKIKVIDSVPEQKHRTPMPLPRMDEEKKKHSHSGPSNK